MFHYANHCFLMNNKPALIFGSLAVVFAVLWGISYHRQSQFKASLNSFNQNVSNSHSTKELQQAVDTFFSENTSAISFLNSHADEFPDTGITSKIKLQKAEPVSASRGTQVTISGLNLTLPAYVVFGPGLVKESVSSQSPNSITFTVPSKVVRPACPPFPKTMCTLLGASNTANTDTSINPGTYTVYVANTNGEASNPISFEVTN